MLATRLDLLFTIREFPSNFEGFQPVSTCIMIILTGENVQYVGHATTQRILGGQNTFFVCVCVCVCVQPQLPFQPP